MLAAMLFAFSEAANVPDEVIQRGEPEMSHHTRAAVVAPARLVQSGPLESKWCLRSHRVCRRRSEGLPIKHQISGKGWARGVRCGDK